MILLFPESTILWVLNYLEHCTVLAVTRYVAKSVFQDAEWGLCKILRSDKVHDGETRTPALSGTIPVGKQGNRPGQGLHTY